MCILESFHILIGFKMNRKTFIQIMENFSSHTIENDRAWRVYLDCIKLFKNSDKDTTEYLESVGSMTHEEKLRWRTKIAEIGIELTPIEIDDYIFILSLAIMKR